MFFRQRPLYRVGLLVLLSNESSLDMHHMLICGMRWVKHDNENQKHWVYDGVLLRTEGNNIVYSTGISCVLEKSIQLIRGIN